ncbi:MAG: hypothetical protein JWM27_2425 [Gemmatimonadetes bacterium]|nr:hypothetical protein [Gemmatimonadota bacterium]
MTRDSGARKPAKEEAEARSIVAVSDWLALLPDASLGAAPPPTRRTWEGGGNPSFVLGGAVPRVDFGSVDPLGVVDFVLNETAGRVDILGDWTGWKPVPMALSDRTATIAFALPDGEHAYAFRINGRQLPDPTRPGVFGVGPHGPYSSVHLTRFERTLGIFNPSGPTLTLRMGLLPPWLSADVPRLKVRSGSQRQLCLRIDPAMVPAQFDEEVQLGTVRLADAELPFLVRIRVGTVRPRCGFVPADARVRGNTQALTLDVNGRWVGAGTLRMRVLAFPGLRELARSDVEHSGSSTFQVTLPFGPIHPAEFDGRDRADLVLDTGAPVWNLRFHRLAVPLLENDDPV